MSFTIMTAASPFIAEDLLGGDEGDIARVMGPLLANPDLMPAPADIQSTLSELTARTIAEAIAQLPARSAILDGEIASMIESGVSSFSALQEDLKSGRHDRMRTENARGKERFDDEAVAEVAFAVDDQHHGRPDRLTRIRFSAGFLCS